LNAQCEEARKSLADAKRAVGELASEGHDTTAALREMRQAHDRLDAVEAAVTVATQKGADAVLREAASQAKIEAEVEVVANTKAAFLEFDQLLIDLERLAIDKIDLRLNAARLVLTNSGIRDGELNFLAEAPLLIKRHLLLAVCTVIGEGFVPVNLRKYERLSQCILDADFIRSRERPGPSPATPIPGWQIGA